MTQPPQWPDLSGPPEGDQPPSDQPSFPAAPASPAPAAGYSAAAPESPPPQPGTPPPQPGAPTPPSLAPPPAIPAQPLYPGASYGTPPGHPHSHGYAYQSYPYQPQPRTNGLAIASMVLSIVGGVVLFCVYFLGGIPGLLGAILGHVARRQVRERGEAGDGMALAGIIIGWIVTGFALLMLILFVVFFAFALTLPFTDPPEGF
jgi:hypothetical protein